MSALLLLTATTPADVTTSTGEAVNVSILPDTATVISVLIGVVLPWLTGRVTTMTTHPALRGATLLALSAITSVLTELGQALASGAPYDPWHVILGALATFALGVVMHTGVYRSLGAYQANQAAGGIIGPQPTTPPAPKGPST